LLKVAIGYFMKLMIDFKTQGAQVCQLNPSPVFYMSPNHNNFDGCLRGGQPVIFPQFGERGMLKKDGFARDVLWDLISESSNSNQHTLMFVKEFNGHAQFGWPYKSKLTLSVEYKPGHLKQSFEVINTGAETFSWTGGLHPYFAVKDLLLSRISGLFNIPYKDRYSLDHLLVAPSIIIFDGSPCEKIFASAPDLTLDSCAYQMNLKTVGFQQWMIWNPGIKGAEVISDLPDDDWRKFICIEPVCVDNPVVLEPGQKFLGQFDISFNFY